MLHSLGAKNQNQGDRYADLLGGDIKLNSIVGEGTEILKDPINGQCIKPQ